MVTPNSNGFTLIELVVVMLIVSILAAIAIPAYEQYVIRGQLVNATDGLSAVRTQMEQYFQDNRTYADVTGGTTDYYAPCDNTPTPVYGLFTITCTGSGAPSTTGYTLTATGSGIAAGFVFTIDQNNNQLTTAVPSGWGTVPATCWLTKKGQTC